MHEMPPDEHRDIEEALAASYSIGGRLCTNDWTSSAMN